MEEKSNNTLIYLASIYACKAQRVNIMYFIITLTYQFVSYCILLSGNVSYLIALHHISYCIALLLCCVVLRCVALRCCVVLCCIVLHCISLHCIVLHYFARPPFLMHTNFTSKIIDYYQNTNNE